MSPLPVFAHAWHVRSSPIDMKKKFFKHTCLQSQQQTSPSTHSGRKVKTGEEKRMQREKKAISSDNWNAQWHALRMEKCPFSLGFKQIGIIKTNTDTEF